MTTRSGPRPRSQSDPTHPSFALTRPEASGYGHGQTVPAAPNSPISRLVIEMIGEHPVAGGAFSDVWKAVMMRDGKPILVAYKVLRLMGYEPERLSRKLEQEVSSWRPLDHSNIATFYGVDYRLDGLPAMVSQWCGNGSADAYLRQHRENPSVNPMAIILEIAGGVEYLHDEKRIVHGDLKGVSAECGVMYCTLNAFMQANVMIDEEGHAKLIDFGLLHLIDSDEGSTTSLTFSLRWCAPELLSPNSRTTQASDVYAFGSTVLELLTGQVPYETLGDAAVTLKVISGVTPRTLSTGFPHNVPRSEELWNLLEKCWDEIARRSSIREVQSRLRELYS